MISEVKTGCDFVVQTCASEGSLGRGESGTGCQHNMKEIVLHRQPPKGKLVSWTSLDPGVVSRAAESCWGTSRGGTQ